MSFFPQWWDFLTLVHLGSRMLYVVGWFALALVIAPPLFTWFDRSTKGYVAWMVDTFDRMFMTVEPKWCTVSIAASMLVFFAVGMWLTSGVPWTPSYHIIRVLVCSFLVLGPFNVPVGFQLPRFLVRRMWNKRIQTFEDQLLDALTFMSNGLRSGLSLIQSMEMVVEELGNPISEEFRLILAQQRVGVPFEEALLNLEQRIGSEDVQIMVTSINILRQSGGNLSETFETISHTIRERKKVQGKIRSLTAQGIAQAVIIVAMPFALAFILWTFDHQLIARLWQTWIGWLMISMMLFLQTVGALIMKKIVTIRV
jgi:tight adherence protein B